ncbi:MAG TPA: maltose alpha-D-glucosyltransferase [Geminicoccus sp.]|uniref:maltose alpha-D-glucosyltransferase n=1 Tax=Geminicoccus sp. TaxID=2024832 RepID=UPI002B991B16|nr:maltose alpha-D-glucosyltransferase [Geminicoccus sp.]HWL67377.1 maltose alpha-D-glucosyltransferase [Geminicoccus sp.]
MLEKNEASILEQEAAPPPETDSDIATGTRGDPLWYKDAIIYQLHVKSFFDSNNDGIGDFAGLLQKLDYIASLGVNTIWLLPFYPSPRRDDGYDIAEYRDVSPDYGTLDEFRTFVKEAHARGLRVITELVINHTSDQHPWFQRARRAPPGSPERDFYVWSDNDQKYPETRIIFIDTEKSNWTWDPVAGAYFWHRFYSHQPDLNFDNPQVLEEVLSVMRYWLDMGIDGLRLDAIPYLVEREGTNNENLPETHVVLKKIRAALDKEYPDRMLLAEANQWPEDTQQYFGDGDECHMAFHFPLMPRMYMAIAKEDRFPITDILRQTPEIPSNCQWAIFLRNHDELTLEMVTDEERDYLWNTYAADKRARINLGIRRRLGPLMQRDRRRIELMNALLLSMPGTPVVYYGDEIGMGDNIYLGDRDGVRTPMQWSPDRNGGFSRADPAGLVLPPIMDPLYGYETVNVEAQSRDQHSLLNWMRRALTLRRSHPSMGRGSFRLLYPANRKVLAYLRELDGDTILCVANLSRAPQAVELDLSAYAGYVPLELTGPTPFPPIGQLTYLLTLPPYGFFGFQLMPEADSPKWRMTPPEQLPEFETIVLRHSLGEIMEPRTANAIAKDILPTYLPLRRWFAAKNERLTAARVAWSIAMPFAEDVVLGEIEATLGDRAERYFLPLGVTWDGGAPNPLPQQLALARVRRGRRVGFLTDGFAVDRWAHGLLRALCDGTQISTPEGRIDFVGAPGLDCSELGEDAPIRWLSAEQSNSSLVIGDFAMIKLVRRIHPGIHPEAEMTRHLTEAGYANSSPLLGEVLRVGEDGTPHTLVIVQGAIRNQGDAWHWLLENLKRTIDEHALMAADEHGDDEEVFTTLDNFVGVVGRRLGELHAVLARPSDDPSFAPVSADAAALDEWRSRAANQLATAFTILERARADLEPELVTLADRLLTMREPLLAAVDRLAEAGKGTLMTRIHGDFHLGQVLVAHGDAYIIDFEGEPVRPLAERRAITSPLRDVAGLLRSLDYAAVSAVPPEEEAATPQLQEARLRLVDQFRQGAEQAFLAGYVEAIDAAPQLGFSPERRDPLLDLFLLEKAAYEVQYEAANRPRWLGIPLRGLATIADRLTASGTGEVA